MKLKKRLKTSHKGQNGKVLIIGGSEDYPGAPTLAAMAALAVLRSGADLVTVAAPSKVAWVINTLSPDIITKKLTGKFLKKRHAPLLLKLANDFDVVLLGNGIGLRKETKSFVNLFIRKRKHHLVLDADAIKLVNKKALKTMRNSVITPHSKELEYFLKNNYSTSSKDLKTIRKKAREFLKHNVILLKGQKDTIIGKKLKYNKTGNAGMTVAGTGDVLAGLVAGLMAQGNDVFTSAYRAALINGSAGDKLKKKMKYSFTASDLISTIPKVM